jgi:DNA-binding MarR family transcriptional regulator
LTSNHINPMKARLIISRIGRIRDKANTFLAAKLQEAGIKGVSPSHGEILWALLFSGELSMKKLAVKIHRDKSTVTALVNKLIQLGYVSKRTDESDSRVNLISLTQKGMNLKKDVMNISESLQERAYKGLKEEELVMLMKLLDRIDQNL